MPDYWDIDRILAEEHPITCKLTRRANGVGWLDPHCRQRGIESVRFLFIILAKVPIYVF